MSEYQILVPDIGDFDDVEVIEILVEPGDRVAVEDPLITLESDKATMDVPSPRAGRIREIRVAVGDKVSEGALIAVLTPVDVAEPAADGNAVATASAAHAPAAAVQRSPAAEVPVRVPDIGDFEQVDVIDILVEPGDAVAPEDPLITLESDKATMDIPAPAAGRIENVAVKVGDKVSEGDLILYLSMEAPDASQRSAAEPRTAASAAAAVAAPAAPPGPPRERAMPPAAAKAHASPGVRRLARELGVDIGRVPGTGPKGRILKADVQHYVKEAMQARAGIAGGGFALPEPPAIDFSKFGEIETRPLNKIKRLTGQNLHRSWITAPHVTQFDEADITELEAFRKARLEDGKNPGAKLTLVAFLVKAAAAGLAEFPDLNASLSPDGRSLIHKKYFHIGLAIDTDQGLVVPVIRDVDRKSLLELAAEVQELARKARDRKLAPADMQGGCFTVSSLGGVGGTAFTPIINVPEVAILGVSPAAVKPVYRDGQFVPRLMLPYALSYDHRVIDGVAAARFTRYLATVLGDIRHILL